MNNEEMRDGGSPHHPYQRLQGELAELIASTPPGSKLPAEPELARQLGVSRATLREAMRSFEGQGIIRRRQGVGTFVVAQPPVIETGLEVLESIESQAKRIGLDVSMGDLETELIRASAEVAEALVVPEDTELVKVSRVIKTGSRPVAYLVDILPQDILTADDLDQGFTGSVLDLLLRRGEPELVRSVAEVRAVAASGEIARALEIQRGDVLLQFIARLYCVEERVIDYSLSYFLPGYFSFKIVRRVGDIR
ncbi:MAG: GntR family transcriptional regulator [Chloroflexi bacterium]|nr:GntR family transcriptional regulator [Chloroflexota bacterium]